MWWLLIGIRNSKLVIGSIKHHTPVLKLVLRRYTMQLDSKWYGKMLVVIELVHSNDNKSFINPVRLGAGFGFYSHNKWDGLRDSEIVKVHLYVIYVLRILTRSNIYTRHGISSHYHIRAIYHKAATMVQRVKQNICVHANMCVYLLTIQEVSL